MPRPPHPAPHEARLLEATTPRKALAAPLERGVAVGRTVAVSVEGARAVLSATVAAAPGITSLVTLPRVVRDQRDTECCVSCAVAGAVETLHTSSDTMSPVFHYYVTRFVKGASDAQGRLKVDDAIATLITHGICREADHASVFDDAGIRRSPAQAAFSDAARRILQRRGLTFPVQEIASISRAADIRSHLRDGHPVILVFTLPMGYPSAFLNSANEWMIPGVPPGSSSHHCVLAVGFDDLRGEGSVRGAVRVWDSAGTRPSKDGTWWLGYRVLDSDVTQQAFALT